MFILDWKSQLLRQLLLLVLLLQESLRLLCRLLLLLLLLLALHRRVVMVADHEPGCVRNCRAALALLGARVRERPLVVGLLLLLLLHEELLLVQVELLLLAGRHGGRRATRIGARVARADRVGGQLRVVYERARVIRAHYGRRLLVVAGAGNGRQRAAPVAALGGCAGQIFVGAVVTFTC